MTTAFAPPMTELEAVLNNTREVTTELRRIRKAIKLARTQISIYKNDPSGQPGLIFQGTLNTRECTTHEFRQRDNIAAPGNFECRAGHYIAKFIATIPNNEEECKNIIIRVDRYGGAWRWSGLLKSWSTETRDGVDYFKANFVDDLQFLTYMLGPPNPLLPIPVFQFPRDFFGWAPTRWLISTFIYMQIVRLEGHPFNLPNDPFDLEQYSDIIHPGRWQVQIKGVPLLQDSSLWGPIGSRMNTVDSVIADALEDAQQSIIYRRIFTSEGETVSGLLDNDVANGQLVLEIVDRSGFSEGQGTGLGTFFSGNIIGGAVRSVVQYASGYVEDSLAAIADDETMYPDEYWQNSWMATLAAAPAHCLHDSHWHDLQVQDTHAPATAVRAVIGGDNPTADAIAQLIIQSAGNLIGYFLLGGFDSLGDIASDIIMPFLVGTILAWGEWQNHSRTSNLGWVHLHEVYQSGAEENIWSLAATAAWRGAFKSTDAETSHTMVVGANSWFIPGLHGSIGDRMMSSSGLLARQFGIFLLFINQIKEMSLRGQEDKPDEFLVAIGENKAAMSSGERNARMTKLALDKLHDIGVRLVN